MTGQMSTTPTTGGAVRSTITIDERFGKACLQGLDGFSHIGVLFIFDQFPEHDDYREPARTAGRGSWAGLVGRSRRSSRREIDELCRRGDQSVGQVAKESRSDRSGGAECRVDCRRTRPGRWRPIEQDRNLPECYPSRAPLPNNGWGRPGTSKKIVAVSLLSDSYPGQSWPRPVLFDHMRGPDTSTDAVVAWPGLLPRAGCSTHRADRQGRGPGASARRVARRGSHDSPMTGFADDGDWPVLLAEGGAADLGAADGEEVRRWHRRRP